MLMAWPGVEVLSTVGIAQPSSAPKRCSTMLVSNEHNFVSPLVAAILQPSYSSSHRSVLVEITNSLHTLFSLPKSSDPTEHRYQIRRKDLIFSSHLHAWRSFPTEAPLESASALGTGLTHGCFSSSVAVGRSLMSTLRHWSRKSKAMGEACCGAAGQDRHTRRGRHSTGYRGMGRSGEGSQVKVPGSWAKPGNAYTRRSN